MDFIAGRGQDSGERKPYYVSVQAGQILEDPKAAAYELEITANDEEIARLEELFEELASMDEAQTFHFAHSPYGTASDSEINRGYDDIISDIYRQLYDCGTDATKRHIESMEVF